MLDGSAPQLVLWSQEGFKHWWPERFLFLRVTAEREVAEEVMRGCHLHRGTQHQGAGGQQRQGPAGRLCLPVMMETLLQERHGGYSNPGCHQILSADVDKSHPGLFRMTSCGAGVAPANHQWERRRWQRGAASVLGASCGARSQPQPTHGCTPWCLLSSPSHLCPTTNPCRLHPDPHPSGTRMSYLTGSPVPYLL